jgi:hypothetical protein
MNATTFAAFQLHTYESAQLDRDLALRAAQAERRSGGRRHDGDDRRPERYALAGPAA